MDNARRVYDIRANYHVYLKLKRYVVHRMPGDNNCLYHSIAAAVGNFYGDYMDKLSSEQRKQRQQEVRNAVFIHMKNNKDDYKDFFAVEGNDDMLEEDLDKARILEMKKVTEIGWWGGNESIVACAAIYNKRIIVEKPMAERFDTGSKDNAEVEDIIFLSYVDNNHYNLLQKDVVAREPKSKEVSLYFKDLLRLKGLEYVYESNSDDTIMDALSVAFTNKDDTEMFKQNLLLWLDKQIQKPGLTEKYFSRMRQRHPQEFHGISMQHAVINEKQDFKNFVIRLLNDPSIDESFLIELVTESFEKSLILHRPLDEEIFYKFHDGGLNTAVHMVQEQVGLYSVVKNITRQEEEDDEVTFIDPKEKEANTESIELSFIQGHVLRNIRSKITVVFLVPGKLEDKTLGEALRKKPDFVQMTVFYNNEDLTRMKADKELRQVCTMYEKTFSMPMNLDLTQRLQRLASFLIPPLFWIVNGITTWNGIPYDINIKYSPTSFPTVLLKYMWPIIRKNVMADVAKLLNLNVNLICDGCFPECELASVQSHFDASKFFKANWEIEDCVESLDSYTGFNTQEEIFPDVIKFIQNLYEAPEPDNANKLLDYLDNMQEHGKKWSTYMVIHLDGPNMDKYPKNENNYYNMMQDFSVIKCVYVGKTTDSAFRWSHYVTTTSLSKVFSKTSRLFLLRSKKFGRPDLANEDEAMIIEIITTWMESWNRRRKKTHFLFLNLRAEIMPLLKFANKSDPKIWAEFASSDVHVLNFSPDNKQRFDKCAEFKGNFAKITELKYIDGNFNNRSFKDLEKVYDLIRTCQP